MHVFLSEEIYEVLLLLLVNKTNLKYPESVSRARNQTLSQPPMRNTQRYSSGSCVLKIYTCKSPLGIRVHIGTPVGFVSCRFDEKN